MKKFKTLLSSPTSTLIIRGLFLRRNILRSLTKATLLTGLALSFGGCTENGSLAPQDAQVAAKIVQSNRGPIRLLGVDLDSQSLAKTTTFSEKKKIKAKRGGIIEVGDRRHGISTITFKKNDLPKDMTIEFTWMSGGTFEGMLNNLEFGPHGLIFNNPVEVALSYKEADLKGFKEKELRIFYYNEDTGLWEYIGGEVDEKEKQVIAFLDHFSRYALGAD